MVDKSQTVAHLNSHSSSVLREMPTVERKSVHGHTWELKAFIYIYFESILSKSYQCYCAIMKETFAEDFGEGSLGRRENNL